MKQETGEESVRLEAEFQRMIVDADAEEPFELQKIDIEVYVGISLEKRQYGFNCEIDLSESGYEELVKSFVLFIRLPFLSSCYISFLGDGLSNCIC